MSGIVLSGDTSGAITLNAPAVAGTNTQNLVPASGDLAPLIRGTAQNASGTAVDFTGIPSWVKRITVIFSGVSTNGASNPLIQVGTSSGVVTTGYLGSSSNLSSAVISATFTTGFGLRIQDGATNINHGSLVLTNITGNTWVASGVFARSDGNVTGTTAGNIVLSATLDRIRITTVNGTDTFDAGSINIMYE